MPTGKEVLELFAKCVVTYRTINGKQGACFQNNGKYVFIPCNGQYSAIRTGDKDKEHDGMCKDVAILRFDKTLENQEYSHGTIFTYEPAYNGIPIRPVMDKQ